MKSLKYLIPAMAVLVLAITPSLAFGQYNTGTQGCCGLEDPNWMVTLPGGTIPVHAYSVDPGDPSRFGCPGGWCPPSPGSWWINPTGTLDESAPAGLYEYSMRFGLSSPTDIKGEFAADNSACIYIDTALGQCTTGGDHGFDHYTPFDFGVLGAGTHSIDVYVTNEGLYTGLEVEFFATTPEPSSLLLMGTGVLALIGVVRRKLVG